MTDQPELHALRWGFSTLGCPELTLPEVCRLAAEFNIREIEVRALNKRTDFPQYVREEKLVPSRVQELLKPFHGHIAVAGSDFKLVGGGSELNRAMFLLFCEWAESWGIPYVRVFGGGTFGQAITEVEFAAAAKNVNWWRKEKKQRGWRTEILLETHDAFSGSQPCVKLSEFLDEPLGIIWDTHHTWRLAGESPAESWAQLGLWVRHVHFKDSIDQPSERHPYTYVLPGKGQMPLKEVMGLLREQRFEGVVSLEWEKMWHAYLPDLHAALSELPKQKWFANPKSPPVVTATATLPKEAPRAVSPAP